MTPLLFALFGASCAICIVLAAMLVLVAWPFRKKYEALHSALKDLYKEVMSLPAPVVNIIHLGLKDGRVATDLVPTKLAIRPEEFAVKADNLFASMVTQYTDVGKRKSNEPPDWAFLIFEYSGFNLLVDADSKEQAKKALTRLLINKDGEGIMRLFRTLADSVAAATAPAQIAQ